MSIGLEEGETVEFSPKSMKVNRITGPACSVNFKTEPCASPVACKFFVSDEMVEWYRSTHF